MGQHYTILLFDYAETLNYMMEDVFTTVEGNYIESRIIGILSKASILEHLLEESFNASAGLKQLQLPRINLPSFDGDQLAWEGFRDLFKSLIHDMEKLSLI